MYLIVADTLYKYEPELFPGLIYRMVQPKIVLLIFVSGKIVLTGAKVFKISGVKIDLLLRQGKTFTPLSKIFSQFFQSLKNQLNLYIKLYLVIDFVNFYY